MVQSWIDRTSQHKLSCHMACCGQSSTYRKHQTPLDPNAKVDDRGMPVSLSDATNQLARPIAEFTPSIYRFRAADNPQLFESPDLNLVLSQVTTFRHENELPPIPYLREVIIDFTMRSDDAYLPYTTYYQTNEEVHLSAKEHILGALAYVKAKTTSDINTLLVSQQLAEHRALTCLNCPRHLPILNGHTVNSPSLAQSKFAQLAKNRHTSVDNALHICGVCTCLCRAKVHFTLDFIKESSSRQLLQEFKQKYVGLNGKDHQCWIGSELMEVEKQAKQAAQDGKE